MEYFQMTLKDISDAKERGEAFLLRAIDEKFENVVGAFREKKSRNTDFWFNEFFDWPIRFEAFAYLGNKHKHLVPKFARELRKLWDLWIDLMDKSDVEDKRVFWPTSVVAWEKVNPIVRQVFQLDESTAFREVPDSAVKCHVAMFRAKETLGIGGYETYFENAREMIANLLLNKNLFDTWLNSSVLWQISRSTSLRRCLKDQIRLVLPELKKKIQEQAQEVILSIGHRKDKGTGNPKARESFGKGVYDLDFWANVGFFLGLNDLGKEMNELANAQALKILDLKYPNAWFEDSVQTTCLALSFLKLVDSDPSMSAYTSALGWLLKQQNDDGFWTNDPLPDEPLDILRQHHYPDALLSYQVLTTVMALETIDLIRNLQPLPIWSSRDITNIHRAKTDVRLQDIVFFPTPEGATWDRVRIHFLSDKIVDLSVGDIRERRDFQEMGFKDKRRKEPDKLWALLFLLALNHGEIDFDAKGLPLKYKHLKSYFKEIRKRLKHLFQINEDPFWPYREVKAYKAKFIIEPYENGSNKKEIKEDGSYEDEQNGGEEKEILIEEEDKDDLSEVEDKGEEEDH